jgi:hypothetical protein
MAMSAVTFAWRIVAVAVGAAGAFALREGSIHQWRLPSAREARVRLSWSARPERIERCRRLSDAELAQLPAHMRLRLQCEGGFASYLLTLRVDSTVIASDTVRGGGLRHDRPIHLFREIGIPTGDRRLQIDLVRIDSTSTAEDSTTAMQQPGDTLLGVRADREADERQRRAREAMPAHLTLDSVVALPAGRVLLVAYDEVARRLTMMRSY